MRYIELTPEQDKNFASVIHAALTGSGINILNSVNALTSAVKEAGTTAPVTSEKKDES